MTWRVASLPPGKDGRNFNGWQNYNRLIERAWFCPPGWKPGFTAGREAGRHITQGSTARLN